MPDVSKILNHTHFNFYFLLPIYGRESIVFWSKFQNLHFDTFTCFEFSPTSENLIFRGWSVCVYISKISLAQKQITADIST